MSKSPRQVVAYSVSAQICKERGQCPPLDLLIGDVAVRGFAIDITGGTEGAPVHVRIPLIEAEVAQSSQVLACDDRDASNISVELKVAVMFGVIIIRSPVCFRHRRGTQQVQTHFRR